jgi:hypothetical protein
MHVFKRFPIKKRVMPLLPSMHSERRSWFWVKVPPLIISATPCLLIINRFATRYLRHKFVNVMF